MSRKADAILVALGLITSGAFAIWGQLFAAQMRIAPRPDPKVVQVVRVIAAVVCVTCIINFVRVLVLSEPIK